MIKVQKAPSGVLKPYFSQQPCVLILNMSSQASENILSGLVDLIIHLRANGFTEKAFRNFSTALKGFENDPFEESWTAIIQGLIGKRVHFKKTTSLYVVIVFKLISGDHDSILAQETWQLELKEKCPKNIQNMTDTLTSIKHLVGDIVHNLSVTGLWSDQIENQRHKSAKTIITYQVSSCKLANPTLMGLRRTDISTSIMDTDITCRVHSPAPKPKIVESKPCQTKREKKESISTIDSSSDCEQSSVRVRKVSIYSYYDTESEVTFLSNHQQSFSVDRRDLESMTFEAVDSDPEEYELILSEEEQRLKQFKACLGKFSNFQEKSQQYLGLF